MEAFKDMVQLARRGAATEYMTDLVLIWLMKTNATDCRPGNILEVLLVSAPLSGAACKSQGGTWEVMGILVFSHLCCQIDSNCVRSAGMH